MWSYPVGRRSRTTWPNAATAAYAYDPAGHLTALTHRDATGVVVAPLAYTYDAVGNRTTKTDHACRNLGMLHVHWCVASFHTL